MFFVVDHLPLQVDFFVVEGTTSCFGAFAVFLVLIDFEDLRQNITPFAGGELSKGIGTSLAEVSRVLKYGVTHPHNLVGDALLRFTHSTAIN